MSEIKATQSGEQVTITIDGDKVEVAGDVPDYMRADIRGIESYQSVERVESDYVDEDGDTKTVAGDKYTDAPEEERAQRIEEYLTVEGFEITDSIEMSNGFDIDMANLPKWERCLLQAWEDTIATENTDRQLLQSSSTVPDFVQNRIRDSIMDGNVFSDIEGVGGGDMMQLRNYLTESLTSDGGWTIDGVADQLMQVDGIDSRERATTIARTETASVLNSAREDSYQEQGLEDSKFYWTNPLDSRTTQACEWLTKKTNPFKGGNPVNMERLKELIDEAPEHDGDMQDNLARPDNYVIHPNERSSWVRAPET